MSLRKKYADRENVLTNILPTQEIVFWRAVERHFGIADCVLGDKRFGIEHQHQLENGPVDYMIIFKSGNNEKRMLLEFAYNLNSDHLLKDLTYIIYAAKKYPGIGFCWLVDDRVADKQIDMIRFLFTQIPALKECKINVCCIDSLASASLTEYVINDPVPQLSREILNGRLKDLVSTLSATELIDGPQFGKFFGVADKTVLSWFQSNQIDRVKSGPDNKYIYRTRDIIERFVEAKLAVFAGKSLELVHSSDIRSRTGNSGTFVSAAEVRHELGFKITKSCRAYIENDLGIKPVAFGCVPDAGFAELFSYDDVVKAHSVRMRGAA